MIKYKNLIIYGISKDDGVFMQNGKCFIIKHKKIIRKVGM
jgi:hypothetical protein